MIVYEICIDLAEKAKRERIRACAKLNSRIKKDNLPYYCPCCGTHLNRFIEGGYKNWPDKVNVSRYEHTRQDVICPVCGSLPRHRILALWCEQQVEELKTSKILYFAPEAGIMKWMMRHGVSCTSADLFAEADLQLDIQDTGLASESYDFIFCNHVLEHVEDFRAALKEVKRILRKNGMFICSFPMDQNVEVVDEAPDVHTDAERINQTCLRFLYSNQQTTQLKAKMQSTFTRMFLKEDFLRIILSTIRTKFRNSMLAASMVKHS